MGRMLRRFLADDSGQDLVEYALLAALLAIVSITALSDLGDHIQKLFTYLTRVFPPA